jgi:hypothetical protein
VHVVEQPRHRHTATWAEAVAATHCQAQAAEEPRYDTPEAQEVEERKNQHQPPPQREMDDGSMMQAAEKVRIAGKLQAADTTAVAICSLPRPAAVRSRGVL